LRPRQERANHARKLNSVSLEKGTVLSLIRIVQELGHHVVLSVRKLQRELGLKLNHN
jgi:hypothetical protein